VPDSLINYRGKPRYSG